MTPSTRSRPRSLLVRLFPTFNPFHSLLWLAYRATDWSPTSIEIVKTILLLCYPIVCLALVATLAHKLGVL